jgi:hypothetical protein
VRVPPLFEGTPRAVPDNEKPFYPTQVEQLAYSTQKHLLNRVDPRIMNKKFR